MDTSTWIGYLLLAGLVAWIAWMIVWNERFDRMRRIPRPPRKPGPENTLAD